MDDQDPHSSAPPPPPPPNGGPSVPPPPSAGTSATAGPGQRIRRDTANGMIGGVAAGLARHLGVDVVWVRLAIVLLTVLSGPVGVLLYLAAWLIVPAGDDSDAGRRAPSARAARDPSRGPAFWAGVGLVAIGGLILLNNLISPLTARLTWVSTEELLIPLVLIGIGVLIYRSSRGEDVTPPLRRGDDADTDPGTFEERLERWSDDVEQRAEAFEARHEARAAALREAGARSRVAPVTLGLAFLILGGVWLLGSLGLAGLSLTRALAAALLVVGIGLVVGAFRGRGRGLVAAGFLLAPVVVVATLVGQFPGGMSAVAFGEDGVMVQDDGPFLERPAALADLPDVYEYGAGSVTIDLRDLGHDELARAGTTELAIALGVGELRIRLPEHVTADVFVTLGIGRVDLDGSTSSGLGLDRSVRLSGTTSDDGLLVLIIEQGIGDVSVTR